MSENTVPLYTIDQVAARLNASVRTIYRLTADRRIGFFKVGRELRFSDADIAAYLDSVRVPVREKSKAGRPRKAA